jgi:hypothetical protein
MRHELVVHEPRGVDRLHDPAHRLAVDVDRQARRETVQPVAVRRRAQPVDKLAFARN